ncbi:MAG: hypothetical protein II821_07755 [Treponema sp.]|nr:hypothetical protein [Treponema sp.]
MKKVILKSIFLISFIFFISCGSTGNVATPPETAQEAVTQTQKEVADEIAGEINKTPVTEITIAEPEPETFSTDTAQAPLIQNETEFTEVKAAGPEESETAEGTEENTASTDGLVQNPEEIKSESEESSSDTEQTTPAFEESEETAEKVSEEDSSLEKNIEEAPTTDEREKVSEYQIFDEPEVIVYDLNEEKNEIIPEESQNSEPALSSQEENVNQSDNHKPEPESTNEAVTELTKEPALPAVKENESKAETAQKVSEVSEPEDISASRSVTLKINQYLDVTYPGKGWTYIGENDKNDIFNYFGKKLSSKNTTFSLRAKKSGKTYLHFYKNDALTDQYIDDYLEVNVEDKKSTGRVKAPSYAEIVPAKPQRRIDRANENLSENKTENDNSPVLTSDSQKTEAEKPVQKKADKPSAQALSTKRAESTKPEAKSTISPAKTSQSQKNQVSVSAVSNEENTTRVENISDTKTAQKTLSQPLKAETSAVPQKTNAKSSEPPQTYAYTPDSVQSSEKEPEDETKITSLKNTTQATPSDSSLLEKAKKEFEEKKYADALKDAQEYYNSANTRLDEALFLIGQISESNSSVRDIRFAVDSYDMLIKRFPASKYWKEAKQRSIYLKRFYIDIR